MPGRTAALSAAGATTLSSKARRSSAAEMAAVAPRGSTVAASDVADQPGHVLGDQPTDGAAGVDADHDLALRVEDEAGGSARVALARWKARSWALQYGHHAPG
jgi:hypothetical protein